MGELICGVLWGWPTLALILSAGAYFSYETCFFQVRRAGRWLKAALCCRKEAHGGVSQFQALTAALAGSIGTGNIVGVAAAIMAGGPGALFWMWASSLLGMMTVFMENYLCARFKPVRGRGTGALRYIEKAGKYGGALALVYAAGRDITQTDYTTLDSPYNLYLHPGLPPTPIANPGIAAIRAALQPEETDYYFYVLNPEDNKHIFNETLAGHQATLAQLAG